MRHKAIVLAAVLSLSAPAAYGQDIHAAFQTADDLREICRDDSVYVDVCLGYLQGASDLLMVVQKPLWPFNFPYCPPSALEPSDLQRVLATYLKRRAAKTPTTGAGSVFVAMIEAFPCPKQAASTRPHEAPEPPPF